MAMRRKLVAGNWKMHGSIVQNEDLLNLVIAGTGALGAVDIAVCVPYPYLAQTRALLQATPVSWGGQNVSQHEKGAYTGEISAAMLVDFGCRYVIVGHSERRALYAEDSATVALKYQAAQGAALVPILCVGETLDEREASITEQVVAEQLDKVVELVGIKALAGSVIAYEPVWAIGTGKTATPQQAEQVHSDLRGLIENRYNSQIAQGLRIQYGGSVTADNAATLLGQPNIDGALVGGASLKADSFLAIVAAARG